MGFIFHEKYRVELNQTEDQEHEVFEAEQQVWALFRTEVPLFRRLTRLYVGLSHSYGWNFLVYLLDRTPALEMLIIEMVCFNNFLIFNFLNNKKRKKVDVLCFLIDGFLGDQGKLSTKRQICMEATTEQAQMFDTSYSKSSSQRICGA